MSGMYNLEMLTRTINERIGNNDNKEIRTYLGFDMSKTHSQEEENNKIIIHNESIINKLSDFFGEDTKTICDYFDCWKGTCFFAPNKKFNDNIKEFGGWTTKDILIWLIDEGWWILKDIKSDHLAERLIEEPIEKTNEIARIIPRSFRYEVLRRQKWRCNFCNDSLKFNKNSSWKGETAHIDHIHPFSKRDSYPNGILNINELSNLQALCPKCNINKKDKEIN